MKLIYLILMHASLMLFIGHIAIHQWLWAVWMLVSFAYCYKRVQEIS